MSRRRGARALGAWLPRLVPALPLLALACERPERLSLPTLVNVVAQLDSHAYVSLLVELDAPRASPAVRVAQGLVSYDGTWLLELSQHLRRSADGRLQRDLEVADLLRSQSYAVVVAHDVDLDDALDVVHLSGRSALLRLRPVGQAPRWSELQLQSGELLERQGSGATRRYERYGPDRGFAVYLEGDTVRLSLPHDDPDEALELLDDVTDIVAVHWIAEELVPAASLDTLQARFKSAGAIIASAQGCEVDGDLMEWAGDGALAVGGAGHLVQGGRNWKGDRDASFAVAARLAPHALCAAVRVRDDQILPGEDLLTVITDKARFELPVPEQPGRLQEGALQAAFTDRAAFGVGVEFCLHPTSWSVHEGHVPLRVLFRDRDGEGETVVASAPELPWPALAGVRLPRHGRTGALPER